MFVPAFTPRGVYPGPPNLGKLYSKKITPPRVPLGVSNISPHHLCSYIYRCIISGNSYLEIKALLSRPDL